MSLRSRLNPDDQRNPIEGPTTIRTGSNQSELLCGFCNRTYYVDEMTSNQTITALEEGLDNPFCCDECAAEYEELSH